MGSSEKEKNLVACDLKSDGRGILVDEFVLF